MLAKALKFACMAASGCPCRGGFRRWPGCLNMQMGPGCSGTREGDAECWERLCVELAKEEVEKEKTRKE